MASQHVKLSLARKRLIVLLASIAAFFAPFSANSYFPAMGNIEKDLSVTSQQVNLSVTVFMIFQAISPSFWSSLADSHGRRPIYLYTLFIYILACIGVALCQSYWWLLTLRMLQAFGASSVIAIGAGTISDITSPAERGGYFGWFSLGWNLGPLVGPAIGGFLSEFMGWRWIFWISAAACTVHWIILGLILPETLRTLVGNDGSGYANPTPSQWWDRRKQQFDGKHDDEENEKKPEQKISFKTILAMPFQSLIYAKEKDILALLIIYSTQYAACYAITTSLPYLFTRLYRLTESQVGASYLANGLGCIVGAMFQGKMLNRNYQKMQQQIGPVVDELSDELPIEHARLRMSWLHAVISNLIIACYGWCLYLKAHLAIVLGLHFVLGFTSQVIFNAVQTLLVDLFPDRSASVTATNNVFRCLFGALATTLVLPTIQLIGVGWTFTLISAILLVSRIALYLEVKRGALWRRERIERAL
ncbi:major facilitator superfamily domain-containing protein [Zychaea mexicana]|uniref:major facilitator superfamily domain-containing protein n=1 Tax=Zychaea mexicana TaxID=64656 RepID=UPI0022FE068E|nr:major facilitator superfamily domain-containing protein [Zychaea mexicana]KAI9491186.1 major facilitator superfamily domain-containing protein [Zychaea mexicana]